MIVELHPSTVEWILGKMESITKDVMTGNLTKDYKLEKIGQFQAYKELLDNSGFESYGLKFKVEMPTTREYEHTDQKGVGCD